MAEMIGERDGGDISDDSRSREHRSCVLSSCCYVRAVMSCNDVSSHDGNTCDVLQSCMLGQGNRVSPCNVVRCGIVVQ